MLNLLFIRPLWSVQSKFIWCNVICFAIFLSVMFDNFRKSGVTGTLMVNDEMRNEDLFRKQSCYIMQDDNLQPLLTVYEAMMVAANLKLSSSYSSKEKKERVSNIETIQGKIRK